MATVPAPRTWATNDEPTATMFNTDLRDAYDGYFWDVPRVRVYKASAQTIGSLGVSATALTWDSEVFDSDGMHSSGAPTRLTVVTAGIYEVTLHIEWQVINNADNGHRMVAVHKNFNGAVTFHTSAEIGFDHAIQLDSDASGAPQTSHLSFLYAFSVSDYIEATCYNTAAVSVSTQELTASRTFFSMIWLGTV